MRSITEMAGNVYHGLNPERNYRAYMSIVGTINVLIVLVFLFIDAILSIATFRNSNLWMPLSSFK